ncbi:MAG: hypothetical protein MN733_08925 [Nitrososphaera sp.]|nr:hypothetical protein [Nitrososphaera sp.]
MITKNTVIIVGALGILATVFVFFLIGFNRATDPNPNREADLQRLAFVSRPEDVKPQYDANNTAIVTLKVNQKSGPLIVKEFTWFGEVKIDVLTYASCDTRVVQDVLQSGDLADSCGSIQVRLLNMTADSATFEFVETGSSYGCCPYCWHMYRAEYR